MTIFCLMRGGVSLTELFKNTQIGPINDLQLNEQMQILLFFIQFKGLLNKCSPVGVFEKCLPAGAIVRYTVEYNGLLNCFVGYFFYCFWRISSSSN